MEALVSLVFTVLAMVAASQPLSLTGVGLCLYNLLVAWMYFNRQPAKHVARWWETALAIGGTFLPLVAFRPAPMSSAKGLGDEIGMLIQLLGLSGMIWSVSALGISLGMAPADRGLVVSGPYRHVRHPMYSSQVFFCLGYWLANLSWANVAVWCLLVAIQVVRALREERVVAGYDEYASQVRWRFLPGIV
jgi:protein-S-isoprenylcysteine O-methyltransferase Ste14